MGSPNASVGRDPDCATVDFDALLMGGCFCHHCLRNLNPCANGGTCVNYKLKGYTCQCGVGFWGDHCQYSEEGRTSAFPWWAYEAAPPPAPASSSSNAPPAPGVPRAMAGESSKLSSGDGIESLRRRNPMRVLPALALDLTLTFAVTPQVGSLQRR